MMWNAKTRFYRWTIALVVWRQSTMFQENKWLGFATPSTVIEVNSSAEKRSAFPYTYYLDSFIIFDRNAAVHWHTYIPCPPLSDICFFRFILLMICLQDEVIRNNGKSSNYFIKINLHTNEHAISIPILLLFCFIASNRKSSRISVQMLFVFSNCIQLAQPNGIVLKPKNTHKKSSHCHIGPAVVTVYDPKFVRGDARARTQEEERLCR